MTNVSDCFFDFIPGSPLDVSDGTSKSVENRFGMRRFAERSVQCPTPSHHRHLQRYKKGVKNDLHEASGTAVFWGF